MSMKGRGPYIARPKRRGLLPVEASPLYGGSDASKDIAR